MLDVFTVFLNRDDNDDSKPGESYMKRSEMFVVSDTNQRF